MMTPTERKEAITDFLKFIWENGWVLDDTNSDSPTDSVSGYPDAAECYALRDRHIEDLVSTRPDVDTVYLIARHDGPAGRNNALPYLGFGWHVEIGPVLGLVILAGPREHAGWQRNRLASGMLARWEGPTAREPYDTLTLAMAALVTHYTWWT